jgi:hypothetical protein
MRRAAEIAGSIIQAQIDATQGMNPDHEGKATGPVHVLGMERGRPPFPLTPSSD